MEGKREEREGWRGGRIETWNEGWGEGGMEGGRERGVEKLEREERLREANFGSM